MRIEDWFLGFFEADGCFTYDRQYGAYPIAYVGQQDDMGCVPPGVRLGAILFGGTTNRTVGKTLNAVGTRYKPCWKSFARSKDSLLNAVWFFDQHPPISIRKQRDYSIWREMVLHYIVHGRGDEKLNSLADDLSSDGRTKNKGSF